MSFDEFLKTKKKLFKAEKKMTSSNFQQRLRSNGDAVETAL